MVQSDAMSSAQFTTAMNEQVHLTHRQGLFGDPQKSLGAVHRIEASTPAGEYVGHLDTHARGGHHVVNHVQVSPAWQGEGVATGMYHHAREIHGEVRHAGDGHRNEAGLGWANHVGGRDADGAAMDSRFEDRPPAPRTDIKAR